MTKGGKTRHVVCAGAGLGFVLWGIWCRLDTQRFVESAVAADGKVIEITSYRKVKPDKTVYEPIIQFEDAAGELVSFTGHEVDKYEYAVGDTVEVLYEKEQPEVARIDNLAGVWGETIMLIGFGMLFVVKGSLSYTWMTVSSKR